MKNVHIIDADAYPLQDAQPEIPAFERGDYEERIILLLGRMKAWGLSHAVVYADREHFANMEYLTGFEPRFEESLLVVEAGGRLTLVVGNECMPYSFVSPLLMDRVLYQNFSLQGQPRDRLEDLKEILSRCGVGRGSKVGVIGFKYFEPGHMKNHRGRTDIPAYIADDLAELAGRENVVNFTPAMTNNADGIRMTLRNPKEIAFYEAMCCTASNRVIRMLKALTPGMGELEASAAAGADGTPINMFPIVNFGEEHVRLGLRSPGCRKLSEGDVITLCCGLRGSLVARSGLAAQGEEGIPESLRGCVTDFYKPFFAAVAAWYESLNIGACCGNVYRGVMDIIGDQDRFGVGLNPGHFIGMDEWTNSPFYKDSSIALTSGAYLQSDIIASAGSPLRQAILEDGVILADEGLRNRFKEEYSAAWRRITARRAFLRQAVGLELQECVLPLSNSQAVFHPYLLDTGKIFALK